MNNQTMCPFCPIQGIDPDQYLPIGNDFYGQEAHIGTIRSCGPCAQVAQIADCAEELIADMKEHQAKQPA